MIDQSASIRMVLDAVNFNDYFWVERHGCIVVDSKFKWVKWNNEESYILKYITNNIGQKLAKYLISLHNHNRLQNLIIQQKINLVSAKIIADTYNLNLKNVDKWIT